MTNSLLNRQEFELLTYIRNTIQRDEPFCPHLILSRYNMKRRLCGVKLLTDDDFDKTFNSLVGIYIVQLTYKDREDKEVLIDRYVLR